MDLDIQWKPEIGDPTFMGWFTVAAYFAAAVLAEVAAVALSRRLPPAELGRQARVWAGTALLFVVLGVNKELDLQSWFTALARAFLVREGWIQARHALQYWFIVGLGTVAVAFLAAAAWRMRGRLREYGPLLAGLTFTLTFIVLRAASFHHFDDLLRHRVLGVKMNWVLELCGIAAVSGAALLRLRHARGSEPPAASS